MALRMWCGFFSSVFVAAFVSLSLYNANAEMTSSRSKMFQRSAQEQALIGHVIRSTQATNDMECLITCHREQRCSSFNYKNDGVGLPVCNLNDQTKETKPNDFVNMDNYYYYGPTKSPCTDHPCLHGGKCQQLFDNPRFTYRCHCIPPFSQGKNCDALTSDSASNFDIEFPRRNILDYVILDKMSPLQNLTVSLIVKIAADDDHTFFSYATSPTYFNAAFLHQRGGQIMLWIQNKRHTFTGILPIKADGKWHHLAITWETIQGKVQLFIDGKLKATQLGLAVGLSIKGNGKFVLGNDQDTYGGGFRKMDALQGSITRVNVWDTVLPAEVIMALAGGCGNEVGTAVAWRDFRTTDGASYNGAVKKIQPSVCLRP